MDPRRVLTFRAVARAGSISAGTRELGWTQPAVSQQLSALEREAGTPLLLRSLLPQMALRAATLDGVWVHTDPAVPSRTVGILHRPGVENVPAVAAALAAVAASASDNSQPQEDPSSGNT